MGAKLVAQVFAYGAFAKLKPNEFRLLTKMALTALDADKPPRYFDSREASAIAIGRIVPDDENDPERLAAFEAVKVATRGLVALGAIERARTGHRGTRAEYVLRLDPDLSRRTDEWRKRERAQTRKPTPPPSKRSSAAVKEEGPTFP